MTKATSNFGANSSEPRFTTNDTDKSLACGLYLLSGPRNSKMAAPQAGNKRGRASWEECEDVSELKQHLTKQAEQIKKLGKDNTELKKALAAAEGKESEQSSEDLAAFAGKVRKNIVQSLEAQMVRKQEQC